MTDEILTLEGTAQFLKVSIEAVNGLVESGELPGRRIDGEWRTTSRAVLGFVDGAAAQSSMCCVPVAASGELVAVGGGCCDPSTGCC